MNNKLKTLSIIIPNYNSGKLLLRCINSILKETSDDYEIVIVDDGSTDNSIQLLPDNAKIKVFRQENNGVSSARNKGLKNAKAKYIMFVDADDTLSPDWGKELAALRTGKADLVVYNYCNDCKKITIINQGKKYIADECSMYIEKSLKNPTKYMTVWGKFFKSTIIKNNSLKFDPDLRLGEDGQFVLQYLMKAQNIEERPTYMYHYQNNSNSVMRTFDRSKVKDYLFSLKETRKIIINQKSEKLNHWFSFYIAMHVNLMMVHQVFDVENKEAYRNKISLMKEIVENKIIYQALKDISPFECNSVRMLPILFIKLRLYFLAARMFIIRSKQNHN